MAELSDWTNFGKMQADYIRALAEYGQKQAEGLKLSAEASKTEAEADLIRQKVAAVNKVLRELDKFFNKKSREWATLNKENERTISDVKNVGLLVSGAPIGHWSNVWVSYKRITDTALLEAESGEAISELKVSDESYGAENFIDNSHPSTPTGDMPRNIKYVLAMMYWMKKTKCVASNNGRALRDVRRLLVEVNKVAIATKAAIQARMEKIDDSLYFNWVLPTIGKFINSE